MNNPAREKVSDERLSFLLTKCVQCFTSDEGCDGTPCETYAALNELYERRRAERLRTSQEWQPIESAPHGDVVLFCDDNGNRWTDVVDKEHQYPECGSYPTHWMYLPPPPKGEAP